MNLYEAARAALLYVSGNEGRFDSCNLNTDGAGLSWGILQWCQSTGNLGKVLSYVRNVDPAQFDAIMGPHAEAVVALCLAGKMDAVDGVHLWHDPWPTRFRVLGKAPWVQDAQVRYAFNGQHMTGAVLALDKLGVRTQRALTLLFDTAVQQGPSRAVRIASVARAAQPQHRLAAYALACAAGFQRTTPPSPPIPKARLSWQPAGEGVWHLYSGRIDLFVDVTRRRNHILGDPSLSDDPLT
jgi:hypothetical protein